MTHERERKATSYVHQQVRRCFLFVWRNSNKLESHNGRQTALCFCNHCENRISDRHCTAKRPVNLHFSPKSQRVRKTGYEGTNTRHMRCKSTISVRRSEPNTATWKTNAHMEANSIINLLKPSGHVMHQQFNIQQLYVLPTLYLCVLYLSQNKQRLLPLTA